MLNFFKKKKNKEDKKDSKQNEEAITNQNEEEQVGQDVVHQQEPEQTNLAQEEVLESSIKEEPKEEVSQEPVLEEGAKEENSGWVKKLKKGLGKSSSKINEGVKNIFVRKKLDDETLEELEDLLIMSDLGVQAASFITSELSKSKYDKEISADEIKQFLADKITQILEPVAKPIQIVESHKPHVIFMCGVNGTGKTTTIGKLASEYKKQGKTVMMAACDTFRAAAVEQLEVWAKRADCPLIKGKFEADPASVAYEALEKAIAEKADVLIIDTAGRLQNKANLMDQLAKIVRVLKKIDDTLPHDSIIVLDATTGQNANSQVKVFKDMVNLTGIIVTKLDGTAKGGVVVSLAKQFGLNIHAVGVGEAIEDLNAFQADLFSKSLVGLD